MLPLTDGEPVVPGVRWIMLLAVCVPVGLASGDGAAPSPTPVGASTVVEVALSLADVTQQDRADHTSEPLALALLEVGLGDIVGVVPRVENRSPSAAFSKALLESAEQWTGVVSLSSETGVPARVGLRLCPVADEAASCSQVTGTGPLDEAVAQVVTDVAHLLGQRHEQVQPWALPTDEKATQVLMASASVVYGFSEPTPKKRLGSRRDPVARATHLTPTPPLALWLHGQREWSASRPQYAVRSFAHLIDAHDSVQTRANLVASCLTGDRLDEAWQRMDLATMGGDPRFLLLIGELARQRNRADVVEELIGQWPLPVRQHPDVLAFRLRAEPSQYHSSILTMWKSVHPADVRPWRRELATMLDAEELGAAEALIRSMQDHGIAPLELQTWGWSLAAAQEDWRRLDWLLRDEAQVREQLQSVTAKVKPLKHPVAVRFASGQSVGALAARGGIQVANRVLAGDRWDPEALVLKAISFQALGHDEAAEKTWYLAYMADPDVAMQWHSL